MVLISHRGNINGRIPDRENTAQYIKEAIELGYDVEVDIWYKGNEFWLGHDQPDRPVHLDWLKEHEYHLWIHCKNFGALTHLINTVSKTFYHSSEEYTIISNGLIWAHNITDVSTKCVIPLLHSNDILNWTPAPVHGVCSDYVKALND